MLDTWTCFRYRDRRVTSWGLGVRVRRRSLLRERQSEIARQSLEAAALEECARTGYSSLKVEDITKAARCGKGTFYIYFNDKKDLFRQLLRRHASELRQQIEMRYQRASTLEERVRFPVEAYFDFVERNPSAFSLIFREGWLSDSDFSDLFRKIVDEFLDDVAARFELAIAAGLIEPFEPKTARIMALAMIGSLWFSTMLQLGHEPFGRARITEVLVSLWTQAIQPTALAQTEGGSPATEASTSAGGR